MTYNVLMGTGH